MAITLAIDRYSKKDMQDLREKVYLGDQVHAEFDGYSIKLTTENGISITNTIFLEPGVLERFLDYQEALQKALKQAAANQSSV